MQKFNALIYYKIPNLIFGALLVQKRLVQYFSQKSHLSQF